MPGVGMPSKFKIFPLQEWIRVLDGLKQGTAGAGDELSALLSEGVWDRFLWHRMIPRVHSSCSRSWGPDAGAMRAALRDRGVEEDIAYDSFSAFCEGLLQDAKGRGGDIVRNWVSKNPQKRTDFAWYCLDKIRNEIDKEVRRLFLPLGDEDRAAARPQTASLGGSYDRVAAAESLLEIEREHLRPGSQYLRDLETHMDRVKHGQDAVQPGDDRNRLKDLRKKLSQNIAAHRKTDFAVTIREHDSVGNTISENIVYTTLDRFICWERLYPTAFTAAAEVLK